MVCPDLHSPFTRARPLHVARRPQSVRFRGCGGAGSPEVRLEHLRGSKQLTWAVQHQQIRKSQRPCTEHMLMTRATHHDTCLMHVMIHHDCILRSAASSSGEERRVRAGAPVPLRLHVRQGAVRRQFAALCPRRRPIGGNSAARSKSCGGGWIRSAALRRAKHC